MSDRDVLLLLAVAVATSVLLVAVVAWLAHGSPGPFRIRFTP